MVRRAKKPSAAMVALLEAAEQDDVGAQYELAAAYLQGSGVRQDNVAAWKWFRKAAEHGDARAQKNLAVIGRGSPGG